MTDHNLSPQAQAVLDAYFTHADLLNREVSHEEMIGAAIRAAAEELQYRLFLPGDDPMVVSAKDLFNLANELEGGND